MAGKPEIFLDWASLGSREVAVHWALGFFDGVHVGHAAVIASAVEAQKKVGGEVGVLTFQRHPMSLFDPENAPRMIVATDAEKIALLAAQGVDIVLNLPFTRALAALSARSFIEKLVSVVPIASMSIGEGWHFGAKRSGDVAYLKELGLEFGFSVHEVSPVALHKVRVSSSRIRAALEHGDLELAKACLGRNICFSGAVVHGRELGRTIGFPTANIAWSSALKFPFGVYQVKVSHHGHVYNGVANWGLRPSVVSSGSDSLFEVHLLDFNGDLYGGNLSVELCSFIRAERKFESLEALTSQIACDVAFVKAQVSGESRQA